MNRRVGIIAIICIFVLFPLGCGTEDKGGEMHSETINQETGKVLKLTDNNFEAEIKEGVLLVDFWAPWCPPCRTQGPIVEAVAEKIGSKARVAKLNVDEGRNAAAKFGISGIPTLIIFKDGQPVKKLVGLRNAEELVAAIEMAQ